MDQKKMLKGVSLYIRDIIFGVEDSLVSTVGTLTGVAEGSKNSYIVALAGLVLVVVEAVSMAAGSYIASKSEKEVWEKRLMDSKESSASPISKLNPVLGGLIMGVGYVLAGMIPLFPYLIMPLQYAVATSIILTFAALFIAGSLKTKLSGRNWLRGGMEMVLISGAAILFGYIIGRFASRILI